MEGAGMSGELNGKVAVVTGGTSGIGEAIAKEFHQNGATVYVGSRRVMKRSNNGLIALPLDVASRESVVDFVQQVLNEQGKIDILVNAAGINKRHPAEEFSEDAWLDVINVNLNGTYRMCHEVGQSMIARKYGKILNITSMTSHVVISNVSAYAASKGGVMQYTKALAVEWAPYNINVNAISPGFIATEINKKARDQPTYRDSVIEKTPAKRFGTCEEIAQSALFLVSERAQFVTGHIMAVDGGYLAGHPNVTAR